MNPRNVAGRVGQVTAAAVVAGTVGSAALLVSEIFAARNRRYAQPELGLTVRASIGPAEALPLRLVLLGDSAALGVGVDQVTDTVGGQLARLLAEHEGAPGGVPRLITLSSVGVAGSRSTDLATQVARALLGDHPDVAVILIGTNDATQLRRPGESAIHLAAAVRRLRGAGAEVVVGTCPDLGATPAIAPPLRQLTGLLGRRIAKAQARAAREAGARVIDLAGETGAVFRADPGTYCYDGYHPSADGYRIWAHALLPAVVGAAAAASRR
ncbi:SGNH/GDSL hydrolase family protein [Solwaraspora sp. WMMD406]|uniref:SGNH/GDSL hydrolase family protein n=1 Tax=Solwaraspora sp. WMMD406 TaxID=3016095 RepID=UPI0024172318|nr:SGNH/GDSL hydrolase family protein [Solwaraspora sp. WMMD406]MDG4763843.1 SGNH/GDSL hydrolase family protein [Solwaraspora sp. WMMD406]